MGWKWSCNWKISDPARGADCLDYIIKDVSTLEPKPLFVRARRNNRNPLVKLRPFYSWKDPGKSSDLPKTIHYFMKVFLESPLHFLEKKAVWKQCKAKSEQVLGRSYALVLISYLSVWILWACDYQNTTPRGVPTAQGTN